jgi:transcriptional regulator with XRE-family HTH domain
MHALSDTTRSTHADAEPGGTARRALTPVPDRAQREAAAALARAAFGARLKEARDRKGIGLRTIAAQTKVNESLFTALERGDLSRWPAGIYRRSFFRAYTDAIGLPGDALLHEFLHLFPDESDVRPAPHVAATPGPLRLSLAAAPSFHLSRVHLIAAFVDLVVVLLVASAITWWTEVTPATALAGITLIYYIVATALFGSSAGAWWLRWRGARKRFRGIRLAR